MIHYSRDKIQVEEPPSPLLAFLAYAATPVYAAGYSLNANSASGM
jgi:hypothetical protein